MKLVFNACTSGTVYLNLECLDCYQGSCFGGEFRGGVGGGGEGYSRNVVLWVYYQQHGF